MRYGTTPVHPGKSRQCALASRPCSSAGSATPPLTAPSTRAWYVHGHTRVCLQRSCPLPEAFAITWGTFLEQSRIIKWLCCELNCKLVLLQDISESATRALELAEQRLAEAAAELQRRSVVLQEVSAEKDAALAKVHSTSCAKPICNTWQGKIAIWASLYPCMGVRNHLMKLTAFTCRWLHWRVRYSAQGQRPLAGSRALAKQALLLLGSGKVLPSRQTHSSSAIR